MTGDGGILGNELPPSLGTQELLRVSFLQNDF